MCIFENCMVIFLVMPEKTSFKRLDLNVGLQYRKSSFSFREETSRCQQVIKTLRSRFPGPASQITAKSIFQ